MRIISPYKDYYDYMMQFGQDLKCVYNRVPKNMEVTHPFAPRPIHFADGTAVYRCYLSVCGFVYDFFYKHGEYIRTGVYDDEYSFDFELISCGKSLRQVYFHDDISKFKRTTSVYYSDLSMRIHREVDAPIILYNFENKSTWVGNGFDTQKPHSPNYGCTMQNNSLVVNPTCLGVIGMPKVLSATDIFAQISNFVLSSSDKPMIEVSDKTKLVKAGFDDKISFRNRK